MTAMLLCAALGADFEFEEVTWQKPAYRASVIAIDNATQDAIARAPREIEAMRRLASDEKRDFRRATLSRIRLYEHRLSELKAGKRLIYPRLPSRLQVGDVGTLPGPMTIVRQTVGDCYLWKADWSKPSRNLIGQPSESVPSSEGREIQFIHNLGLTSKDRKPFEADTDFDMTNLMFRVVDVRGGIPVLEAVYLPDEFMLDLLAEYRLAKSGDAPKSGIRTGILLSN